MGWISSMDLFLEKIFYHLPIYSYLSRNLGRRPREWQKWYCEDRYNDM